MDADEYKRLIASGTSNPKFAKQRLEVAKIASDTFLGVGKKLFLIGHILGDDRKNQASPFGHGNDEVVGVASLLQMGGYLVSASSELLTNGNPYAGAALLRQLVEIEYLVWAFNSRNGAAEQWLRSDKKTRRNLFSPVKLREASNGQFRGSDYGHHCELGGHPTPTGISLLQDKASANQLMLSDLLGHVAGIWENFVCWAEQNEETMSLFSDYEPPLPRQLKKWRSTDPLADLPPPP